MQVRWGARYGGLADEGYRWVTSVLIHSNALHLLSNTFLFVALSTYVEAKIGFWRAARAPPHYPTSWSTLAPLKFGKL